MSAPRAKTRSLSGTKILHPVSGRIGEIATSFFGTVAVSSMDVSSIWGADLFSNCMVWVALLIGSLILKRAQSF